MAASTRVSAGGRLPSDWTMSPRYNGKVLIGNWAEDQFAPSSVFPRKESYLESTNRADFRDWRSQCPAPDHNGRHDQMARHMGLDRAHLFDHHGGYLGKVHTLYDSSYNRHDKELDGGTILPSVSPTPQKDCRSPAKLKEAWQDQRSCAPLTTITRLAFGTQPTLPAIDKFTTRRTITLESPPYVRQLELRKGILCTRSPLVPNKPAIV
eukprot:Opistho-1_new@32355